QINDVNWRQRRIRNIVGLKFLDRAANCDIQVVLVNGSADEHVQHWFGLVGIGEGDQSALEMVLIFGEENITRSQVGAADDDRIRCGADNFQIGCAFNSELRSSGVQLAGGLDYDLELQIVCHALPGW